MEAYVPPQVASTRAADDFQLVTTAAKHGSAEDQLFSEQVADIQRWWQTERFAGLRRPYTAHDVASKRGTQQVSYPSSVMASKLFKLLREREASGEPLHTREYFALPLRIYLPVCRLVGKS